MIRISSGGQSVEFQYGHMKALSSKARIGMESLINEIANQPIISIADWNVDLNAPKANDEILTRPGIKTFSSPAQREGLRPASHARGNLLDFIISNSTLDVVSRSLADESRFAILPKDRKRVRDVPDVHWLRNVTPHEVVSSDHWGIGGMLTIGPPPEVAERSPDEQARPESTEKRKNFSGQNVIGGRGELEFVQGTTS